ncbi:MAG: hemerythrin domain-containing protein [Thermoplasmata archaeon]|uniref:Hemerythrin domain-containing protein n=1 Tax=Candidatus Sysuiplasma superficiale TaxID=2823368 RepID=A0A8J7YQD0_9ARCH|nr:hemerythrin domain-containing protein [Candidatus Sysuiplasma superficiale]MBX8645007.1 hemerythrin domain-containing protein [Candidatus Sysuiplasma superficiale]MCL4346454.1 hemerythrin domain-containing protein [Candidatus Thermoplasmatota archaeon]
MRPRELDISSLIDVLEEEHRRISGKLSEMSSMLEARNMEGFRSALNSIDDTLLQHMLDEEATLLREIIRAFGREGARESIEVFQEHVDIDALIKRMKKSLENGSSGTEEEITFLSSMLSEHFRKEHSRVFPCALDAARMLD